MTDGPILSEPPAVSQTEGPAESRPAPRAGNAGMLLLPIRWLINSAALAVGDVLSLLLALGCGQLLRWMIGEEPRIPAWFWLVVGMWIAVALGVRLLPGWGLGVVRELRRIALLLPAVFTTALSFLYFSRMRGQLTRIELGTTFLVALFTLPFIRSKTKHVLIQLRLWGMLTVVYGTPASAARILAALHREPGLGYVPIAVADPDPARAGQVVDGLPVKHECDPSLSRATVAIIAAPPGEGGLLQHSVVGSLSRYRHVLVIPDLVESPTLWVEPRDLGGILGLEIAQNLADPWGRALKRLFELGLVLLFLPLWAPTVFFLALLIRLIDRHPPFFGQDRKGRSGVAFRMWKLRTMVTDGGEILKKRLEEDEEARLAWSERFKLADDPRMTRLGRMLRRASLDELPQLWNVLKGQMSLVGPRPLPDYHYERISARARTLREGVRPGMTGLWQVAGRGDNGLESLADNDAYYVRNWSIWFDLVIMVRTWRAVMSRTGAY